jgi:hypothetical protein
MATDRWTDKLSEYLDGELNKVERDALEKHLEGCAECSAVLEELRVVTLRAESLDDRPPARDLWSGIAERIGSSTTTEVRAIESAGSRKWWSGRRITLGVPQLAAAAVALVVLSGTVVGAFVGLRQGDRPATVAVTEPGITVTNIANFGGAKYDSAVAELEQALSANKGQLDSATVKVIKQNLAIIDRAIDQARQALAADPASPYLSNHLAGALRQKVELLRRVTGLSAVQS